MTYFKIVVTRHGSTEVHEEPLANETTATLSPNVPHSGIG